MNCHIQYVMWTSSVRKLFSKAAQENEMRESMDCAGREIVVCIIICVTALSGACVWTLKNIPALEL